MKENDPAIPISALNASSPKGAQSALPIALLAVAIVISGCGKSHGLYAIGDAAAGGTGGIGAGGNAGATGAEAGSVGGISIAGNTAISSDTGGAAIGGGGAISSGGRSAANGGTGGGTTTGMGGVIFSGGNAGGSVGRNGGAGGTGGATTGSGGSPDGSAGRSGGTSGAGGATTGSGGSPGDSAGQSGDANGRTGGVVAGAGGSTGGVAGSGGSSGTGGAADSCPGCQSLEQCWNGLLCVANSRLLPAGFSIDSTEVTRGQYAAWLATKPSTNGQDNACLWNASYAPDATCMVNSSVCQGTGCAQHPQPCIDMCDAVAYCKAVGKRLCGKIGGGSVPYTSNLSSINDATQSEWYNACTSNGVNGFTYGNSVLFGKCNDYTFTGTTTMPVGSMAGCQSPVIGYAEVFDLIGNLWEWEDNCNGSAGDADLCYLRGSSFGTGAQLPNCKQETGTKRSAASPSLGFRCCVP